METTPQTAYQTPDELRATVLALASEAFPCAKDWDSYCDIRMGGIGIVKGELMGVPITFRLTPCDATLSGGADVKVAWSAGRAWGTWYRTPGKGNLKNHIMNTLRGFQYRARKEAQDYERRIDELEEQSSDADLVLCRMLESECHE